MRAVSLWKVGQSSADAKELLVMLRKETRQDSVRIVTITFLMFIFRSRS